MNSGNTNIKSADTYNDFERSFAAFLDGAEDVRRFILLSTMEQEHSGTSFLADYQKPSEVAGCLDADWVVVQNAQGDEVIWIVETRDRVSECIDEKHAAARKWCKRMSETTGKPCKYVRIDPSEFDGELQTFRALIINMAIKTSRQRQEHMKPVTQDEIRRWKEEGRR